MLYTKTYSDLIKLKSFEDRFLYLQENGHIGEETFGNYRWLNQKFYTSSIWKQVRRDIIIRDRGCDLGTVGCHIHGYIYVHHINPITIDDVIANSPKLYDPENLISASQRTHKAIHYGDLSLIYDYYTVAERTKNDTCLWRY